MLLFVTFTDNIKHFKRRLISRGYLEKMVENIISEVNYADRKTAPAKDRQEVSTLCDAISTIITMHV